MKALTLEHLLADRAFADGLEWIAPLLERGGPTEEEWLDKPHYWVRTEARQLVLALPSDLPLPEFAVEDDGAIAVEWLPSRSRMVSISVHGRGRVAYAWLDGTDKGHGVARFNGKELPEVLLSVIRSVTDDLESKR